MNKRMRVLGRPLAVAAAASVALALPTVAGAADGAQSRFGRMFSTLAGDTPSDESHMLAESEIQERGVRLGEVGGRIIAEVFLRMLAEDPSSYLNARRPFTPTVEHIGEFTIGDFLIFAGVVEEEEEPLP